MNKTIFGVVGMFLVTLIVITPYVVYAVNADYCCEKTEYGAWCQNAPEEKCDPDYRMAPTSCDATSYCRAGCCYDSSEGLCMENTPQRVCDDNGGTWHESAECEIPQCELGCCVLDNQAAFVTLSRCKKISGFYGVQTDFRLGVGSELECIALAQLTDKGACVYESEDYIRTCKFTTREKCKTIGSANGSEAEFYKDYLCSAEELATECGPSEQTTCVDGKEEVYFVDTCGNPANIYDANKLKDKLYWKKIVGKDESCGAGVNNANSKTCGNCNYFLGSLCKSADRGNFPQYGENICQDLNCYGTSDGKDHRHGESWCSYDGNVGEGRDAVGSRHVRHICVAGEELVEPCEDYRNKICIESYTDTGSGIFTEAACIVNRWQDCGKQNKESDCENTDKRECRWTHDALGNGVCVPQYPPGLKFWEEGQGGECSRANAECIVTFEKGLFESRECIDNCECWEEESGQAWAQKMNELCISLGDCGGYVNWIGKYSSDGYQWNEGGSDKSLSKGIVEGLKARAGVS